MTAREWLSVGEAAEELGLAESTIVRGIEAGRIEAVRFGESHKGTRIHRAALMPWLKGEFTHQSQIRARAALLTRLREQRLVVERMETDLAQERRRLLEMIREVEIDGSAADDGRRLRVV